MVVRRAEMLPLECIVRGYLSGSAWAEYQRSQTMHGEPLPAGLRQSERLPEPVFTPSTKATTGHDENISFAAAVDAVGHELAEEARRISLAAYQQGAELAAARGIIIADTKFELGVIDGRLAICDEVLTPGLLPLLARRSMGAGPHPAGIRQAAAARLARRRRAGTRRRRRRRCLPRWCKPPGIVTWRPTSD